MSTLQVGDRVTTDTKWNFEGVGTGTIVGVEVPDRERSGHLRIEEDPVAANKLLKEMGEPDGDGIVGEYPRIVVNCFDPDDKIKEMFGHTRLCFYHSNKIEKLVCRFEAEELEDEQTNKCTTNAGAS